MTVSPVPRSTFAPRRAALAALALVVVVGVLLSVAWPLGVAVGLVASSAAVLVIGRTLEAEWDSSFEQHAPRTTRSAAEAEARRTPVVGAAAEADESEVVGQVVDVRASEPPAPVSAAPVPAAASMPAEVTVPSVPATASAPAAVPVVTTGPSAAAVPAVTAAVPARRASQAGEAAFGGPHPDLARAARLVVTSQYASAARLQRELHLPYSRARRLLDDLESRGVVGPSTGPTPRRVLMARDDLEGLERLLAAA